MRMPLPSLCRPGMRPIWVPAPMPATSMTDLQGRMAPMASVRQSPSRKLVSSISRSTRCLTLSDTTAHWRAYFGLLLTLRHDLRFQRPVCSSLRCRPSVWQLVQLRSKVRWPHTDIAVFPDQPPIIEQHQGASYVSRNHSRLYLPLTPLAGTEHCGEQGTGGDRSGPQPPGLRSVVPERLYQGDNARRGRGADPWPGPCFLLCSPQQADHTLAHAYLETLQD